MTSTHPTSDPTRPTDELADSEDEPVELGRRKLLTGLGVGAGALVVGGCQVTSTQDAQRQRALVDAAPAETTVLTTTNDGGEQAQDGGNGSDGGDGRDGRRDRRRRGGDGRNGRNEEFTRLFNEPSFAEPSQELREALNELGRPGGIMDANDDLARGPVELITDLGLSINNPNNPANSAGTTFVGQFLDHDLTLDAGSRLGRPTPLGRSTNLRSPRFDLDSVYGAGPATSPELYEPADPIVFRVESGGRFEDVPRDDENSAILGDGRNDENLMLSGLQAAYLMFHNAVVERVRSTSPTLDDDATFDEARRQVRWHHQWLILNEFLPQFVGQDMVDDVRANGRQFVTGNELQMPVEFQTSAYRFGHSLIRPSYRANMAGDNGEPFFGFVFDPDEFGKVDPDDLAGRQRAPRRYVGWQTFFDFGDGEVRPNKRIDTTLSTPLFQLPLFALPNDRGDDVGPTSLAARNLLRHITWEIPSGQRIAELMGVERLTTADFSDLSNLGANLQTSTPLWFYILREADLMADGLHLGPVGGRIVAEVFLSALELDDDGFLADGDDWTPTLPALDSSAGFQMTDLLTIAGVDPTSRGE